MVVSRIVSGHQNFVIHNYMGPSFESMFLIPFRYSVKKRRRKAALVALIPFQAKFPS